MPDLTAAERLLRQRALRDWLTYQLRQTEGAIRRLEAEEAEERRREEKTRTAQLWKLQPGRVSGMEPMLHRADCSLYKTQLGYLDHEHVLVALEEFPELEICSVCDPPTD
ncbi:DUF6233 domain-containing protein [Streptomyces sp. NPDC127084]|uniref:DUF6233 domain-containing protein n=1 Tax=Streptomyces sp. NPDC127084 TaxID=3347133 RepID=UPI003666C5B9